MRRENFFKFLSDLDIYVYILYVYLKYKNMIETESDIFSIGERMTALYLRGNQKNKIIFEINLTK